MITDDNNGFVSNTKSINNYSKGWHLIFSTFGTLLGIILISLIVSVPANIHGIEDRLWIISLPYLIFVSGPIKMSTDWVFLKGARKETIRIKDMFSVFERNYWNAVGAGTLKFIIIMLGLSLLVIPGIIFACRLVFVEYLIVDRKMKVMESFRASWTMTKGHSLTIIGMFILSILISIVGLLTFIVGGVISLMWISASFAVFYHSICLEKNTGTEGKIS